MFIPMMVIIITFNLYLMIRNNFTCESMKRAAEAVYNYIVENEINTKQNIFKAMLKTYDEVLFLNLLDWSPYVAVKDQYVDDLKEYFE
jgi:hypothetical protein